ncbi:hypothetical protein SAMN04488128_103402 [Chitinophaga eiseniae]|uniref:Uncharacterized protein n=1 Tax=Chitinophaga eiseniae TaxID=634771 RepID=A0A1T4SRY4_9BACT|nr:hypothetical protein [Chitinophaga eiseniae]SKA31060.1 hypothetical protein SAMN04488128_103402 [Chitinophaga eiseniae]
MIFLSAQPDEFYFSWQLELQLFNFSRLGIQKENIHVLIGYQPVTGLSATFQALIRAQDQRACFFCYPDNRTDAAYPSSIRPHIIRQHLETLPQLQQEAIFYHDADIIFREQPDWEQLLPGDTWYVADTRYYTSTQFIRDRAGQAIFSGMCRLAGIGEQQAMAGDDHCGGAQYLLKNTTPLFWEKVEAHSAAIYGYLREENDRQAEQLLSKGEKKSTWKGFDPWFADMWALYWNALTDNRTVRISDELDFCWATSPIGDWETKKILHYTGRVAPGDRRYFRKVNFYRFPPWFDKGIRKITPDNCSYPLLQLIAAYITQKERISLSDTLLLVPVTDHGPDSFANLLTFLHYIDYYLDTTIIVAEVGDTAAIDISLLPSSCKHVLLNNNTVAPQHAAIANHLLRQYHTPVMALCDPNVIPDIASMADACHQVASGAADVAFPHNGHLLQADSVFSYLFDHFSDPQLLLTHQGKFISTTQRYAGGCLFLNRDKWLAAGGENEYISHARLAAQERLKRFGLLEYRISHSDTPCFHLAPGATIENKTRVADLELCLYTSNLRRPVLEQYIQSWPWYYFSQQTPAYDFNH